MGLTDPAHAEFRLVDLTARPQQNRLLAGDEKGAIQRRGLARDQLGPQRGEVSDVLVFPNQQGTSLGIGQSLLRLCDALTTQIVKVITILPVDGELPLGVPRNRSSYRRLFRK